MIKNISNLGDAALYCDFGNEVNKSINSQVIKSVSYTHLRAHETDSYLVCRLLLEKKK